MRILRNNSVPHYGVVPRHAQIEHEVVDPMPQVPTQEPGFKDRTASFWGPGLLPLPTTQKTRQRRSVARRMYVPVDETGASTRYAIWDKTTGHVLARVWGSHFHAWKEGIEVSRSLGGTDRDIGVTICS